MAFKRVDEILGKALDEDASAIPRWDIVNPDGSVAVEDVQIKLKNPVEQEGTRFTAALLNEMLAASGQTDGTDSAFALAQDGFSLFDGARIMVKWHTTPTPEATLDVNGTGAKPVRLNGNSNSMCELYYDVDADLWIAMGGGGGSSSPFPVGAIYMSVDPTNPAQYFGGTWTAWGAGRVPVGVDTTQTEFNLVEKPGGTKTHNHALTGGFAMIHHAGGGLHGREVDGVTSWGENLNIIITGSVGSGAAQTSGMQLGGNADAASTLQPYITCYMWKRTA